MVDPKLTYQGRPCKYGHSGQRWISKRSCVECTQFRARQWYRDHPSYHNWCSMKQRCYNPNNPSYEHYGAKGITVCDRWRKSFVDFLADVGDPPPPRSARLWTIDRIDSRGNYEPSNVRWVVTWTDQRRNFPTNCRLTIEKARLIRKLRNQGERPTILAKRFGVGYQTIYRVTRFFTWRE